LNDSIGRLEVGWRDANAGEPKLVEGVGDFHRIAMFRPHPQVEVIGSSWDAVGRESVATNDEKSNVSSEK
jgi:hypothetical protein